MKIILSGVIIAMAALTAIMIYYKYESPPIPITRPISSLREIEKIENKPVVPELIQKVNRKNSLIDSLSYSDVEIKLWEGGMKYRLSGAIRYEKSKRFKMQFRSLFGVELEVGSNKERFWFWSRRNKVPGIHWAVYEDYFKTRLKTPFNPVWMKTTFGIDEIDLERSKILDKENYLVIVHEGQNALGKEVLHAIFIDKQKEEITSVIVTDTGGKPLASCEILESNNGIPLKMLYTWHEEGRIVLFSLRDPKINRTFPEHFWSMPDINPKVNMGIE